ncbi:MAG TPA: peptidase U32 family protein, partial [Salinivirgaceae bacterium]|nr:peptidase U32 family protein [Salinivirgaceae bacterium]
MPVLELLSPAKNKETAIAAFYHGADAVYMGARKYGARENAGNSTEEIQQVVSFAHQFGGKVYATVNTIFYKNETEEVRNLIIELWEAGVDALIIQDPGILELNLPPIRFHMSTQANNRTLEQICFWEKTGISRVVLARELSIEQIGAIREKTTIELEAFIHGALCVCYSGNCYMSADINHRSANRGNCAQPCRLPYDVFLPDGTKIIEQKHILSTYDLETTNVLDKLIYAGITSFKIEGRLKDISYVKNITAYYHQLLNQFISQNPQFRRSSVGICNFDFDPNPSRTFSRKTSTYFYLGRSRPLVNFLTPKSIGQKIGKVIAIEGKKVTLETSEELNTGDGICYLSNNQLLGTNIVGIQGK